MGRSRGTGTPLSFLCPVDRRIHGGYIVHDEMSAALFVPTEEVTES